MRQGDGSKVDRGAPRANFQDTGWRIDEVEVSVLVSKRFTCPSAMIIIRPLARCEGQVYIAHIGAYARKWEPVRRWTLLKSS